jgi:hypothetical protein
MLERVAGQLAASVDAVCADLLSLNEQKLHRDLLIPVVVTTARLYVTTFDPATVSLETGEIDNADFQRVPAVRFRKSLGPTEAPDEFEAEALRDYMGASLRTVFVVEAAHFAEWLGQFGTGSDEYGPWHSRRALAGG